MSVSKIVFGFLLIAQVSWSQSTSACVEIVVGYINKMTEVKLENGKTSYMKYTTSTKYHKDLNIPDASTTSELYVSADKQILMDPTMKVYADAKDVFVVIEPKELIYWNDSDPVVFQRNNTYKVFLELEKKIIGSGDVKCLMSDQYIQIIVNPTAQITQQTNLIKQEISYNKNTNKIEKVTNYYNKNSKFAQQSVHYQIIEYNGNRKLKESAKQYVLNANKLIDKYKTYTLIDNRTK